MMRKATKESCRKYDSILSCENQTNLIKVIAASQQKDKPPSIDLLTFRNSHPPLARIFDWPTLFVNCI